ncbi:MAG: hypothetical protein ACI837_001124 [Crocinitomicaceae bacterium]|jgi:hypothetical protein
MKRITTLGITLVSVLFFTACKKESSVNVDQNRIYSTYNVEYDQNSNRTTVKATYRVDHNSGQKIELTYPSRVDFDGEQMAYRKMGGYYDLSRNGNALNREIIYHDIDGKVFSNSGSVISSIDVPVGLNGISRSGNFFLPWVGAPLASGETITVTISGGSQTSSKTFTANSVGQNYIILDQFKLNDLIAGTAKIQIKREITGSLIQSNLSGGRISSTYNGRKITINILD